MKIIKNLIVIALVIFLISNVGQDDSNRLAAASETAHVTDHSGCETQIAMLETQLAEARKSFDLILRVELEFVPGLFGDWASIDFHSTVIGVNAAAAESLAVGTDLRADKEGGQSFLDSLIDCRIIVERIDPQ